MIEPDDEFVPPPREGAFDEQLSFSVPYVEAPSPIKWIVKRDGREVEFEQRKIADAIFNAAGAVGGQDRDRAESLASAVTIFLGKALNGATPSVDQVHDAVEKVLIEMGHARTALAYVRYRDRRSRVRKLQQGDVSSILKELDEARRQREALDPVVHRPLFVRTSDELLSGWDRERIVAALVREARLPEADARRVAAEVEVQVTRANLSTLTAPLVRELVDAKLVELDLGQYRARHMRLGVPLYDAEQIICTPTHGEVEGQQDPAATDVTLAQRVKREFALAAVHSAEVAEAHMRGDIHLHGLSQIDRAHSASHSLEFIKRFGLAIFSGSRFAPPPATANALIAQSSRFTTAMQRHFIEGVRWSEFNEALTPILDSGANMERIARLALFGLISPVGTAPTTLEFTWPHANMAACMFAVQFAEVWGAAIDEGSAYGIPHIDVLVDAEALRHADYHALLESLLDSYERRSRVTLRFDRGTQEPPARNWTSRDLVGGIVTLNLPRVAFELSNEAGVLDAISQWVVAGFNALSEKRNFLERLFAFGGVGPLAALTFRYRGRAYADPQDARYVLGVTGLNECVQALTGNELYQSDTALDCAHAILQRLREDADDYSANHDIDIVVCADDSEACARRFARLDLQLHGDSARAVAKSDAFTRDATYTPGVSTTAMLSTLDKIRNESDLHLSMNGHSTTPIPVESSVMGIASVIATIESALHETGCTALRFVCGREQLDFGQL